MNLTHNGVRHIDAQLHQQRLELDQTYQAKIVHIPGELNTGVDGLSRLPMASTESTLAALPAFDVMPASTEMNTINNLNHEVNGHFPMNMMRIKFKQDNDEEIQAKLANPKHK